MTYSINDDARLSKADDLSGHNGGPEITDNRLRLFIERIERLEDEKAGIQSDIKDTFAEAKGTGYDPKIMREVLKIRKMDPDQRREHNAVLETYLCALGYEG